MIAALASNPAIVLFSSIMLVSSVTVWISLSDARIRIVILTALLLLQSANIALAAISTPSHVQLPVLVSTFLVLSVQWVLIAIAFLPGPDQSNAMTEPTR